MLLRNILNGLGILSGYQQQQLAAEVLSLRKENQLLRSQAKKLAEGHKAIIDYSRQMSIYKTHAQLMEWDTAYALSHAALGWNEGRAEARHAVGSRLGNDPKQRTAANASKAVEAAAIGKSPIHTDNKIRR